MSKTKILPWNQTQNVLFIDGSYTQSGLVLADNVNKKITLGGVSVKATKGKSFAVGVTGSFSISQGILFWLDSLGYFPEMTVVIEAPYPTGFASPSLYGLDFSIIHKIHSMYRDTIFYTLMPSRISFYTKRYSEGKDSKVLRKIYANDLVPEIEKSGWIFNNKELLENSYNDDIETSLILWWNSLQDKADFIPIDIPDYDTFISTPT